MTFRGPKSNQWHHLYIPLRAKQLLSETFLSTRFSFQDIGLDHLKWDTLYIYIYIYIYICVYSQRYTIYSKLVAEHYRIS